MTSIPPTTTELRRRVFINYNIYASGKLFTEIAL